MRVFFPLLVYLGVPATSCTFLLAPSMCPLLTTTRAHTHTDAQWSLQNADLATSLPPWPCVMGITRRRGYKGPLMLPVRSGTREALMFEPWRPAQFIATMNHVVVRVNSSRSTDASVQEAVH